MKNLIIGHDPNFCDAYRPILEDAGVEPVVPPPRSHNLNAHPEQFMGSLKPECVDRMIISGLQPRRNAIKVWRIA